MTTTINEKTYEYRGLSTDVKPLEEAGNGSVFIEMDTGKVYIFDEENLIWIELSKKSGDSDTGSGESGGGASITSNIKIVANKDDILSTSDHNKLCILSDTSELSFKVVDKIEGGSEELSTLSVTLPKGIEYDCCAPFGDNFYIFGGRGESNSKYVNTIYKYNATNKTITTLSITLPVPLHSACCATYEDNIYIFGGYSNNYLNTIYKFNCTNETITTLSTKLPKKTFFACCTINGDNIYIFGGQQYVSETTISNTIYKFNCTSETIETLTTTLPQALYYACCSSYNGNIYIFGGNNGSSGLNTIYKYNCVTKEISTLSTTLPKTLYSTCCATFGNNIYIFGGRGDNYSNNIYKFNCINETIEELSTTLPQKLFGSCCSIFGSNIYIFGGANSTTYGWQKTIYNFSVSFELTANNVLILNANSNYSFELITDQVTIPIKNIYIGDSNNTAQLANAYLYDETQTVWVNVNASEVLS